MNKKSYLDLLRYYLRELPKVVVDDIIYDYEEHFNIGMEKGKSEEEISKELGSPEDIAREYLAGSFQKKAELAELEDQDFQRNREKKSRAGWIILLILLSPLILALVLSALGIIVGIFAALVVTGGALVVGGFAIILNYIPALEGIVSLSVTHPLTRISLAITFICLGIILFYLGIKFIQLMWRLIKKAWLAIRWKWVR